jgi:hypothetical protein
MIRRRFNFDFETFPLFPGCLAPPLVCMAYRWDDGPRDLVHARTGRRPGFESLLGKNDTIDEILLRALIDDEVAMVAYNANYEATAVMAHNLYLMPLVFRKARLGLWHCCYIRETQIRIARGKATDEDGNEKDVGTLADISVHYGLPAVDKKFEGRLRYGEYIDTPIAQWPQPYIDYALDDLVVGDVDKVQRAKSRPEEYVDHATQMSMSIALSLTSCRGIRANVENARVLVKRTKERVAAAQEMILDPKRFGFDSEPLAQWKRDKGVYKVSRMKAPAVEYITKAYAKLGLLPPRKLPTVKALEAIYAANSSYPPPDADQRKMIKDLAAHGIDAQGNISLDKDACEQSQDELLSAYSDFGQANTLLTRAQLVLTAAERGMPLQTGYNVIVDTGRTSCRQGKVPEPGEAWTAYGIQIQNLPRSGEEICNVCEEVVYDKDLCKHHYEEKYGKVAA